jgi:hypothetical protein
VSIDILLWREDIGVLPLWKMLFKDEKLATLDDVSKVCDLV